MPRTLLLTVVANLAYFLMLCAFVTRDILYLRSLLVVAQTVVVLYTWRAGVPVIAAWNLLFVGINAFMAVQILRERRAVVLTPELQQLHDRHFAALSPTEFLRWWREGRRETFENETLVREGQHPDWLYFLLRGTVQVTRRHRPVTHLTAGYFVAEMSLLTGEPANADVEAVGSVEVVRWEREDLRQVRERNPVLWTKIQSVIGRDIVEKLQRNDGQGAAAVYPG